MDLVLESCDEYRVAPLHLLQLEIIICTKMKQKH
jgi:hypothetical protein